MIGATKSAFRRLFPLRILPKKIKQRLLRDIIRLNSTVIRVHDFKIEIPLQTPGIGNALALYGHRELDQYSILRKVVFPGDTILDIGANIGYYVLVESNIIGTSGYIYAYEPDFRNIKYLEKNIQRNYLNSIVSVYNHAVSNSDGSASLYVAELSNLSALEMTRGSGKHSIVSRGFDDRKYVDMQEVNVVDVCTVLDTSERPIDVIRMDIEGHEVQVLGSIANRFEKDGQFPRSPRVIVFEPHSWEYTLDLGNILETLCRFGYSISFLGSRDESCSPMHRYGYYPIETPVEARGVTRGVYNGIKQDDAIELASRVDGVTTVCLQKSAS